MEVAMGTISEFGLLLLLVFAFSAPLLQNVFGKFRGHKEDNEEN
jgi:hypothetical protein